MNRTRTVVSVSLLLAATLASGLGCETPKPPAAGGAAATGTIVASASVKDLMQARGLSEADVEAALKT
jgi:hypothetical protein